VDRLTFRQAVGEDPINSPWFSSEDFDPTDPDEVEVVRLASQTHAADRIRELEDKVERLEAELAQARGEEDDGYEDVEAGYFAPEPWEMTDGLDMPGYRG
jgi:hypothetical protein